MNIQYSVGISIDEVNPENAEKLMLILAGIAVKLNSQQKVFEKNFDNQLDGQFDFNNAEDAFQFIESEINEIPNLIISSAQVIEEESCTNTIAELC